MSYSRTIIITIALLLAAWPATPAPSRAAAAEFSVVEASLQSDPARHAGRCPVRVVFRGVIRTNGPGTVKYTFTRSDGAAGSVHRLDFKRAEAQTVETVWTLGGAELTNYEGWQALRILEPNAMESARANFALDCQPGGITLSQNAPQPPPPAQNEAAAAYLKVRGKLIAAEHLRHAQEMDKLEALVGRHHPALEKAGLEMGLDAKAVEGRLQGITREPDEAKRAQLLADFQQEYRPQLERVVNSAGIDIAAERSRLASELNLDPATLRPVGAVPLDVEKKEEKTKPTPEQTPAPPDVTTFERTAPYAGYGTNGDHTHAFINGYMSALTTQLYGSSTASAFVVDQIFVERGVRLMRVHLTLDPVDYSADVIAFFGYVRANGVVRLRVLEGGELVGGNTVNLPQSWGFLFGGGQQHVVSPVTLECSVGRLPDEPGKSYTLVAEVQVWAGAGGPFPQLASTLMRTTVRKFEVTLRRSLTTAAGGPCQPAGAESSRHSGRLCGA